VTDVLELHIYDFDGTLFRSPDRPDWWGKSSWVFEPISMNPPCVPPKPGSSWWISSTVRAAKQSIGNPDVYAVLCTGRPLGSSHRYRIPELLKQAGLNFNEIHLNPGGTTKGFKATVANTLLRTYPEVEALHIWEDAPDNISAVAKVCKTLGKVCVPHMVKVSPHPVVCTEEQVQALADEGWVKWKRAAHRVAGRWIGRMARRPTPESRAWKADIKAHHPVQGHLELGREHSTFG